MITVSMSTWESLTSMSSMTSFTARMSALRAMTMMPLMRSSARILMLSLLSSPSEEDARCENVGLAVCARDADVFAAVRLPACCVRLRLPWLPRCVFWFWLFLDWDEELPLPMRSFSIDATLSASAYLRRITSTWTSGVVSTSSVSMTLSKKSMFAFDVMTISLFERSSARMSTLPRIMPRSASETCASIVAFGVGAGGGCCWPGRFSSRRGGCTAGCGRAEAKPGAPEAFVPPEAAWVSFCDSVTIVSSAVLMSVARAYWIWRTKTSSSTGFATSSSRMTSSMRLMFSCVSVTRIVLLRWKTWKSPFGSLKPSIASCASLASMCCRRISWLITRPFSGTAFVAGSSIDVRMPWVRTDLRSKARMKMSSNGSMTMPCIVRVTSMASRYSSRVSSRSNVPSKLICALGRFGDGSRILPDILA